MQEKIMDEKVDYSRWNRIITRTQQIIIAFIFVVEAANNAMLYWTRSQGYAPDTIVDKLFRYFISTTLFNVGVFLAGQWIIRKTENRMVQKIILILVVELICTNVAFSHYQFSIVFAMFLIPIVLSILYEDLKLLGVAMVASILGLAFSSTARGLDPFYSRDIGPEVAIGFAIILATFLASRFVLITLKNHGKKISEALVQKEKEKRKEELEAVTIRLIDSLAQTIEAKDSYTDGHSFRVSVYSAKFATALKFSAEDIETLRCDALLHDIGKISVPDAVLNKPGKLTNSEFEMIKAHSQVGSNILKDLFILPYASEVAGAHHERFDGKGYPKGLKGKEIPPFARIVAIADAYDAMSSNRIYRRALSHEEILRELVNGRGTQFDPEYLDAFLELFDSGKLEDFTLESPEKSA